MDKNKLEQMSHDDLHSVLLKVVGDCTKLFKQRSPQSFLYTQFVVIYTLCELGGENTKLPPAFHDTLDGLKRDLADELIGKLNVGEIPSDPEELKMLLHRMRDIEFIKV